MRIYINILFVIVCISIFKIVNSIEKMNFTKISLINTKCLDHYDKYVEPIQSMNVIDSISFDEYLEYWWNLEETDNELVERVCDFIYHKYPKPSIRRVYF